jgi:hypothetical protein
MNEQQLAKIEERWLAASGGPWCVEDATVPEPNRRKEITSAEALTRWGELREDPRNDGKDVPLATISYRSYEEWAALYRGKTREDWTKMLEEGSFRADCELTEQCFRLIYPCKRSTLDEPAGFGDKWQGPSSFKRVMRKTRPAFAILTKEVEGHTREEDVQFVLHAPEDVGLLITEIRSLQQVAKAKDAEVDRIKKELVAAKENVAATNKLCDQMRVHASQLINVASAMLGKSPP